MIFKIPVYFKNRSDEDFFFALRQLLSKEMVLCDHVTWTDVKVNAV